MNQNVIAPFLLLKYSDIMGPVNYYSVVVYVQCGTRHIPPPVHFFGIFHRFHLRSSRPTFSQFLVVQIWKTVEINQDTKAKCLPWYQLHHQTKVTAVLEEVKNNLCGGLWATTKPWMTTASPGLLHQCYFYQIHFKAPQCRVFLVVQIILWTKKKTTALGLCPSFRMPLTFASTRMSSILTVLRISALSCVMILIEAKLCLGFLKKRKQRNNPLLQLNIFWNRSIYILILLIVQLF